MNKINDSKIFKKVSLLAIIFIIGITAISNVSAASETEVIGDIQNTINNAQEDTIILLEENTIYTGSENINLNITKSLTIKGKGAGAIIDADGQGRIINSIYPGLTLKLINITFINGNADYGGAIYNNGATIYIEDCVFTNNKATNAGGAIYSNGDMTITSSVFSNNIAGLEGGAIYIADGYVEVNYSIIYGNTLTGTPSFPSLPSNWNIITTLAFFSSVQTWLTIVGIPQGSDFYINDGSLDIDNNFWGNNGGPGSIINDKLNYLRIFGLDVPTGLTDISRIFDNTRNVKLDNYYKIGITTTDKYYELLIGDELTYDVFAYLNTSTKDDKDQLGTEKLPFYLSPLKITYHPWYITNPNLLNLPLGSLLGSGKGTMYSNLTQIAVHFSGTGDWLDTLGYESSNQYRPFIKDLDIKYITDPIYGQITVITGIVEDIFERPMIGDLYITITGLGLINTQVKVEDDGKFYEEIQNTFTGPRNIEVSFTSDEGKPANPVTAQDFIRLANLEIDIDVDRGTYGQQGTITGKVNNYVPGDDVTVRVIINGRTYSTQVDKTDGTFNIHIGDIDFLTTNYVILAYGNSIFRYIPALQYKTFTVDKAQLTTILNYNRGIYGQQGTINGRIDGIFSNDVVTIKLEINNKTYYFNVTGNGEFTIPLGQIDFLTTTYTVSIDGKYVTRYRLITNFEISTSDAYYESNSITRIFFVRPATLTINIDNDKGTYGQLGTITGKLSDITFDNDDVEVMLVINGQRYYATVNGADGTFTFNIWDIDFSTTDYRIVVLGKVVTIGQYTLNSPLHYIAVPLTGIFNVEPGDLDIIITSSNGVLGGNGWINGTVENIANFNDEIELTLLINGRTYTTTVTKANNDFSFYIEDINFETMSYTITATNKSGVYNSLPITNTFVVVTTLLRPDIPDLNPTKPDDGNGTPNEGKIVDGKKGYGNDTVGGDDIDNKSSVASASMKSTGIPSVAILLLLLVSLGLLTRRK